MKKIELSKSEALAIIRTSLANERTFLAYFRSSIVFLSSGFAIIKIDALKDITDIGYILIGITPFFFLTGVVRFFYIHRKLKKYHYKNEEVNLGPGSN